jgi:hypothetical protein
MPHGRPETKNGVGREPPQVQRAWGEVVRIEVKELRRKEDKKPATRLDNRFGERWMYRFGRRSESTDRRIRGIGNSREFFRDETAVACCGVGDDRSEMAWVVEN